jgi:hypothetical protein
MRKRGLGLLATSHASVLGPDLGRGAAEAPAKDAIEVGQVAKTGVKRDRSDAPVSEFANSC